MKKYWYLTLGVLWLLIQSCSEKTQKDNSQTGATNLWSAIPNLSLPQSWDRVPVGSTADSTVLSRLQVPPDTVGHKPKWMIIGRLGADQWHGLLYTYTDTEISELRLATYSLTDSLLSDIILIHDQRVGILTQGTFSATITLKFTIQTSERLRSAASETDSTIVSDEQTDQTFQIGPTGIVKPTANKTVNHVADAATHPEEEEEGSYYREYHYDSRGYTESFIFTIMGQEREKHYYFENDKGNQRALEMTAAKSNPDFCNFRLDGKTLTAQWQNYTRVGDTSVPQTIIFTFDNGKKQLFTLKQ